MAVNNQLQLHTRACREEAYLFPFSCGRKIRGKKVEEEKHFICLKKMEHNQGKYLVEKKYWRFRD